MDRFALIIIALILSVLPVKEVVAQPPYSEVSIKNKGGLVNPATFAALESHSRRRCAIDLAGRNRVAVRVFGSERVFYYPIKEATEEVTPLMAVDRGLERELLRAPMTAAYAVPRYGTGYGYDGSGLLVFAGVLIEGCPIPPIVTGLFMPINRIHPYVSRQFLTKYFMLE
jgi:hypothetical protein